ncbi:MAG: XRE family transcriptional regulator [Acidobacteria bacterium]|nr:MAG: XRE family transcriptional regulator [Acidobacteriota bacterium]
MNADPKPGFAGRRDAAVDGIRLALRRRVRASDLTQRHIERLNGWKPGYLSQVLRGHITLTVRHLVGILQALDVPLEAFVAELAPGWRPHDPEASELRQRLARYDAALDELRQKGLLDDGGWDEGR